MVDGRVSRPGRATRRRAHGGRARPGRTGLTPVELAEPLELLIDAYEPLLIDRSPFDLPPMYEEEVARYEASRAEIERRFGPIDSARFQVGERYEINFGQSCGTQICPGV